jgi:hypothetical protein
VDSDFTTPVIIADDGELEEVRGILAALGIEYDDASMEGPRVGRLLVSNARHAVARHSRGQSPNGGFHIVVLDKAGRTLRREVERLRPDFLLQRPVDPVALRLLVLHALYGGPERRRSDRVALCAVVRYRTGRIARKATLVDLSLRGCRLMSERALETGAGISLTLPRELTGSGRVALEGRVVGTDTAPGSSAEHVSSIAFGPVREEARRALASVMARHAVGGAPLRPRKDSPAMPPARLASPAREAERAEDGAQAPERRGSERVLFDGAVLAASREGSRVLIGRDLSRGGMRVAPDAELALGEEFSLIVRSPGGGRSTLVKAAVVRDDGEAGWVLRFSRLSQESAAALEEIMASLPPLEGGAEDAARPNVLVGERVEPR